MKIIYLLLLLVICTKYIQAKKPVYTQVTYLYDIKRGELSGQGTRSFDYYKSHFEKQLKSDCNMIIYGDKQMGQFVWKRRKQHNTVFIQRPLSYFKNYWFAPLIQKVRQTYLAKPNFVYRNYVQYTLEYYNLLMMGKLFVMLESLKYDKFNTDILIWVDAGYTHIFADSINIFDPENVVRKYYQLLQPQWVLFCYDQPTVVLNGYAQGELRYIDRKLKPSQMVLAGHQGGYVQIVKDMKSAFENFLKITLQYGDLSADEAIISMMPVKFPYLIPTTTTFYLKQFMNKITIYEDVNRKPTHSRSFGCKFIADDIQIAFDIIIGRQSLFESSSNITRIKRQRIPVKQIPKSEEESIQIPQIQQQQQIIETIEPIKQQTNKYRKPSSQKHNTFLSENIHRTRKQLYLDVLIIIVLLISYFYLLKHSRQLNNPRPKIRVRKYSRERMETNQIIYLPDNDY